MRIKIILIVLIITGAIAGLFFISAKIATYIMLALGVCLTNGYLWYKFIVYRKTKEEEKNIHISEKKFNIKEKKLDDPTKCIRCDNVNTTQLILSTKDNTGKTLIESNPYCSTHKKELKNYLKIKRML